MTSWFRLWGLSLTDPGHSITKNTSLGPIYQSVCTSPLKFFSVILHMLGHSLLFLIILAPKNLRHDQIWTKVSFLNVLAMNFCQPKNLFRLEYFGNWNWRFTTWPDISKVQSPIWDKLQEWLCRPMCDTGKFSWWAGEGIPLVL